MRGVKRVWRKLTKAPEPDPEPKFTAEDVEASYARRKTRGSARVREDTKQKKRKNYYRCTYHLGACELSFHLWALRGQREVLAQ